MEGLSDCEEDRWRECEEEGKGDGEVEGLSDCEEDRWRECEEEGEGDDDVEGLSDCEGVEDDEVNNGGDD